jgi:hypothetical protein
VPSSPRAARRSAAELAYYHDEDWTPRRFGAPAFCAGITFLKPAKATRDALSDESWQESLPDGTTVGTSGKDLHVVRTKYLSELVVKGATLDEQARALGLWADQAIGDLMDGNQVRVPPRQLDSAVTINDEDESGRA